MQTAKYEFTTHQPKPLDLVLADFRCSLQDAVRERNVTVPALAKQINIRPEYLKAVLLGTRVPSLALYFDLQNWMASASVSSESEPTEPASVVSPGTAEKMVAPPPFPQSKALLAWMNLQHSFLYMNLPSPSALFRESVETLNSYFSGFDQEEEKKDAS